MSQQHRNPETYAVPFLDRVIALHHAHRNDKEFGQEHKDGERAAYHLAVTCRHGGTMERLNSTFAYWCNYCGFLQTDADLVVNGTR